MIVTTDKIIRFEANDPPELRLGENELWFINLSKADISQQEGRVTIHFELDEEDLSVDDEEDNLIGDEADLVFENMPSNFLDYLNSLPRELNPPVHPTEGNWKYWALVEDGEVVLFW